MAITNSELLSTNFLMKLAEQDDPGLFLVPFVKNLVADEWSKLMPKINFQIRLNNLILILALVNVFMIHSKDLNSVEEIPEDRQVYDYYIEDGRQNIGLVAIRLIIIALLIFEAFQEIREFCQLGMKKYLNMYSNWIDLACIVLYMIAYSHDSDTECDGNCPFWY